MQIELIAPVVTERLIVRRWEPGDLAALAALVTRADVNRYLYTEPRTPSEVPALLDRRLAAPVVRADDHSFQLAVQRRDTGAVIGDLTLFLRSVVHAQVEIGFMFHPDHHGHGYATESSAVLLGLAFGGGAHRVYARCDARNDPSIAVQTRLGMRREALLRENEFVKGEWTDEVICALLATEYADAGAAEPPT